MCMVIGVFVFRQFQTAYAIRGPMYPVCTSRRGGSLVVCKTVCLCFCSLFCLATLLVYALVFVYRCALSMRALPLVRACVSLHPRCLLMSFSRRVVVLGPAHATLQSGALLPSLGGGLRALDTPLGPLFLDLPGEA